MGAASAGVKKATKEHLQAEQKRLEKELSSAKGDKAKKIIEEMTENAKSLDKLSVKRKK